MCHYLINLIILSCHLLSVLLPNSHPWTNARLRKSWNYIGKTSPTQPATQDMSLHYIYLHCALHCTALHWTGPDWTGLEDWWNWLSSVLAGVLSEQWGVRSHSGVDDDEGCWVLTSVVSWCGAGSQSGPAGWWGNMPASSPLEWSHLTMLQQFAAVCLCVLAW